MWLQTLKVVDVFSDSTVCFRRGTRKIKLAVRVACMDMTCVQWKLVHGRNIAPLQLSGIFVDYSCQTEDIEPYTFTLISYDCKDVSSSDK